MKLLFLIIANLISLGALALPLAPTGVDGGGGNALVCYDDQGGVISARMYDLYEGSVLYGLKFSPLNASIDEKLKEILTNIYGEGDMLTEYYRYKSIETNFKLLPEGVRLKPIDDSDHIIIPPKCKIEQVANFYNTGNIFIVRDFYNKFSDLDKLALILHETIYMQEREGFVKNSRYTRRVVANLLSDNFIPERLYPSIDIKEDFICTSGKLFGNQDHKVTSFWLRKLNNTGDWRLEFHSLNGHRPYTRTYLDVNFAGDTFPLLYDSIPNFRGVHSSGGFKHSLIDNDERITIAIANDVDYGGYDKYMTISWKGFDPGDEIIDEMFQCFKVNFDISDPISEPISPVPNP